MRFILIFILTMIAVGYIFRLLTPFLMKWYIKKIGKKFGFDTEEQERKAKQKRKKEGDISVVQTEKEDKIVDENIGDYIDYEDVKNKKQDETK